MSKNDYADDSGIDTDTPPMQPNGTWLKTHAGTTVEISLPNRGTYELEVTEVDE